METYIIWGWLLVAHTSGQMPIVDPNYDSEESCEQTKADFLAQFPTYEAYCYATWKPDAVRTHRIVRRVVHRRYVRR